MSAAKFTMADDSQGSEDLLLRLLRRRLGTKQARCADPRVDTKAQVPPISLCNVCRKAPSLENSAPELLRRCGHMVCGDCIAKHVVQTVNDGKASSIACPVERCSLGLTPAELRRVLSERDYELYVIARYDAHVA